jgi:hypothetical protein
MTDPHVVSLTYRIDKAETVDFDRAPPLPPIDRGAFRVTIDAYKAKVEMVDHFASVDEAKRAVQPFLRAWELNADLRAPYEEFRFVYEMAEVVDRETQGPVLAPATGTVLITGYPPELRVSQGEWPAPPQELAISPDVEVIWRRWLGLREKQEKLLPAAYWALTILEAAPGVAMPAKPRRSPKRRQAAQFFNIDLKVLDKIGELTTTRGGEDEARKAEGRAAPLSQAERQWLEAVFPILVQRVAEQAYHGGPPPNPLTMSDLPKLTP